MEKHAPTDLDWQLPNLLASFSQIFIEVDERTMIAKTVTHAENIFKKKAHRGEMGGSQFTASWGKS